jgi:hypothetical protein
MNQIQNGFGSLELGIWILFVICYLELGIFSIQGRKYADISNTTYLTYLRDMTLEVVSGQKQLLDIFQMR